MKGSHHIVIETARLKYEFDIRRNITVIRGDSATGKTTLIGLLQAFGVRGQESGVMVTSDVPCQVYGGGADDWRSWIREKEDSIIFIDENYTFIRSREFASCIRGTSNYYVLITRYSLADLPYSVNEIYGIRTSGKFHFPQKVYNEFYHLYSDEWGRTAGRDAVFLTEDSESGYQFFHRTLQGVECISAGGNAGVDSGLLKIPSEKTAVVIADGAAFGAFMEKVLAAAGMRKDVLLYLPESFEWLILRSGIIHEGNLETILDHPEDYVDSARYFSWEQFFTEKLQELTKEDPLRQYRKDKLPDYYTGDQVSSRIWKTLPEEIQKLQKRTEEWKEQK